MRNNAFTLIELLIVIVVIGILVILAVPQYQKMEIRASDAEAMTNLRAISDSLWRYYTETGGFPVEMPPNYDIPACLDFSFNEELQKYFGYHYVANRFPDGRINYVSIYAMDKRPGNIRGYQILISQSRQPTSQLLSDGWYITYRFFDGTDIRESWS